MNNICEKNGFPIHTEDNSVEDNRPQNLSFSSLELTLHSLFSFQKICEGTLHIVNYTYGKWENKNVSYIDLKVGIRQVGEESLRLFVQIVLIAWLFRQKRSRWKARH